MSRILVVYGTGYGHTERIAQRIAAVLTGSGHAVRTIKGDHLPSELSVAEFDAFVVAASVRYGHYQRYIRDFVRHYIARLNAAPSAFVSVCGASAESAPQGARMAQGYIDTFLRQTGWQPRMTRAFAGDLPYTRYNLFTRWMMKQISRRTGRPTDTSRDYDFTNWAMVDQFARELADTLVAHPIAPAAGANAASEAHHSDADELC